MGKFCVKCGTEIKEGYKFCLNCGAKTEIEYQVNKQNTPVDDGHLLQQVNMQQKLNKKLIIALAAIIVIIIAVVIILLVVFGGNSDSRFVGSWVVQSGGDSTFSGSLIFESNGILKTGYLGSYITIGKWNVEGNTICFEFTITGTAIPKICSNYSFSNGGNTLTISDITGTGNSIVLTR